MVCGVEPVAVIETALECVVSFSAGVSASVAVSVSLLTVLFTIRLLKLAEPEIRGAEVVPPRKEALSIIETVAVAAVAGAPLSVSATTGAGFNACPEIADTGGSVVKLSA
jgi:hypothetical protein